MSRRGTVVHVDFGAPLAAGDAGPSMVMNVGVAGAGKTRGLQVSAGRVAGPRRFQVLDRLREWPGAFRSPAVPWCPAVADAANARAALDQGHALVLVRPRPGADMRGLVQQLCENAIATKSTLVLPEAWQHVPERGKVDGALEELIACWRHYGAGLWMDSQRFAPVSKRAVEACQEWRIFALVGPRDLEAVRELGGRELEDAVRMCARRLGEGQPGWHVALDTRRRIPPYRLSRF